MTDNMHQHLSKTKNTPRLMIAFWTVIISGNLVAWIVFIKVLVTLPDAALFEYIPVLLAWYLLLGVSIISILFLIASSWIQRSFSRPHRMGLAVALLSVPIYSVGIMLMLAL